MAKPKKTRKVWAVCFGTGGLCGIGLRGQDTETPCGLRMDFMHWSRDGFCKGRWGEGNPCRDLRDGKPCRRYRATLTLEEAK